VGRGRGGSAGYHCTSDSRGGPGGAGSRRGRLFRRAGVAHLVERDLAKVEVAGSKPVSRSNSVLSSVDSHRGPAHDVQTTAEEPALLASTPLGCYISLQRNQQPNLLGRADLLSTVA
jgi:hypothetical protein